MRWRRLISGPAPVVLLVWTVTMTLTDAWSVAIDGWFMAVTMAVGSFVAGASSEGGGAVAFPVMTLVFDIPPAVARNFSLAIQSVGMTAAAFVIIHRRIPVEWRYLGLASTGGVAGIVLGTLFVVPHIQPAYAKILFVSFWLSFACVLFYMNEQRQRQVRKRLPELSRRERMHLILAGVVGGCLSAIVGSGIDILTFSYVTLRYNLSEKVATPTSVVLMAGNAVVGFAMHALVLRDFGATAFGYWVACIPVVVIGAPVGARAIALCGHRLIARLLCGVIAAQFIGAWWVIRPTGQLAWFAVVVFGVGVILFVMFARSARAKTSRLASLPQATAQAVVPGAPRRKRARHD